jgi:hypothetical protein
MLCRAANPGRSEDLDPPLDLRSEVSKQLLVMLWPGCFHKVFQMCFEIRRLGGVFT